MGGPGEPEHNGGDTAEITRATVNLVCFLLTWWCGGTRLWARAPRDHVPCSRDTMPPGEQTNAVEASTSFPVHSPQNTLCLSVTPLKKHSAVLCPCC